MNSRFKIQDSRQGKAPLFGLVLAGGQSTRMGEDKAAIRYHGPMQSEHCFDLLARVCQKVYLSNRRDQAFLPGHDGIPQINDLFAGDGPMVGILSAMRTHPLAAWLVIACDMPFLNSRMIGRLVRGRDPSKGATAFSASDGGAEPLCAIYEPSCFPVLMGCLDRPDEGPRAALMSVRARLLEPDDSALLMNVNFTAQRDAILGSGPGRWA